MEKFEKICSGIEFYPFIYVEMHRNQRNLDFHETFYKNNDFLTCRGSNLNEFIRILKWYEIFAVLLTS